LRRPGAAVRPVPAAAVGARRPGLPGRRRTRAGPAGRPAARSVHRGPRGGTVSRHDGAADGRGEGARDSRGGGVAESPGGGVAESPGGGAAGSRGDGAAGRTGPAGHTAVEVIRTKRDGGVLSDSQIDWVVDAYTRGEVADEQMAALAMAI